MLGKSVREASLEEETQGIDFRGQTRSHQAHIWERHPRMKEQHVQGLMLDSSEHYWNTTEFSMTGEKGVILGVARAVAGEGSWVMPATY